MNERINILVTTVFGNKIPLDIYANDFTWRNLVLPNIKSIIVQQGGHAAEISGYEQYNFLLEVTQQLITASVGSSALEPRTFWVMGKTENKVDLYVFSCYKGNITQFNKQTEPWGAELDGASTSGWKLGEDETASNIIT